MTAGRPRRGSAALLVDRRRSWRWSSRDLEPVRHERRSALIPGAVRGRRRSAAGARLGHQAHRAPAATCGRGSAASGGCCRRPSSKQRFDFSGRKELYTAYIPWAVAFGCADEWAEKYRTEIGRGAAGADVLRGRLRRRHTGRLRRARWSTTSPPPSTRPSRPTRPPSLVVQRRRRRRLLRRRRWRRRWRWLLVSRCTTLCH